MASDVRSGICQSGVCYGTFDENERMKSDSAWMSMDWRRELPVMTGRVVALREPTADDLGPLFDVLSIADAVRFGVNEPVTEDAVRAFIGRARW